MKISEYNQMMGYLTRPGVKKSNSSTANINNNKSSKSASGDRKDLSKYKGVFRKPLQEASIESLVPDDRLSWAKETDDKLLKYIDGVKNNDPKTLKAIDDYSDQLHYDSVRGQFKKGNKVGALSDFKNDEKLFEPILDRLKIKGKRSQTPIQKKSISREIIKNFQPIKHDLYLRDLEDIKELQEQSRISELRFREAMKTPQDPDLERGIASILKPTKRRR